MNINIIRKGGFTLAELIVVITILSILSTIAALYLFDNFADGRDAARATDVTLISENLELFYTEKSRYPIPDDVIDIMHEGGIAWSQGVFGANVTKSIKNFGQEIPKDPKYNNNYSYSITNNAREYQIATVFEGLDLESGLGELAGGVIVQSAHAGVTTAYVKGDYNNLMVRVRSGGNDYFIATPSIIANDISLTGAIDIIKQQKLVYNKFFNLPASYSGFIDTAGGFDFNVTDPLIFSGSVQDLKTDTAIINFSDKLKYIYATTPTESFDVYQSVLDNETPTKIKGFLQKNYNITFKNYFDCRDILDAGESDGDKFYEIDVDGAGVLPPKSVFCDMTTGGGGWTKKGESHITNGFFQGGSGISGSVPYPTSSENIVVSIDNPAYTGTGYALHQTGDYSSYYEVKFSDFSQVSIGDEIRMTLWVSDEDDDSWSSLGNINPHAYYMFHNRIYYTDGTFSTNGKVRLLDTQIVGGKTWKLLQVHHEVKKQPHDFSWFIGRDTENSKDLYFTGVDLELYYGGYSNSQESLYNSQVLVGGGGTIPDNGSNTPEWWDFRSSGTLLTDGNAPGNDIRYKNNMSMTRTVNGITFSGENSWRSWVKFESAVWNRGDNKTIEWIFSMPTSSRMMLGIGSLNTNEDTNNQYRQAEYVGYFRSNNSGDFLGLYGNNGSIGSQGRDSENEDVSSCASGIIKYVISYDGSIGSSESTIYCLPSANLGDWDDVSDEIYNFTAGGTLAPDEEVILPFITPRNSNASYIALRVG